ncbi:MAG: exodeoxyribonuclease VII large subunit [Verrucomicrobiales bacterium]
MSTPREINLEFNFHDASGPMTGASLVTVAVTSAPALLAPPQDPQGDPPAILTVSQLTRRVRILLENRLGGVWVQGEISNLRRQSSGHSYFTLKDAGAQLSCVLFKSNVHAGMPQPIDGLLVQALGDVTVYEPQGKYQLAVRELKAAGQGLLQQRFEALKRKLAAEGLFDAARKKPLPPFPRCIALVTSPAGAAVRDMLNILARRAPWMRVLISPVRVQGEGAHHEVVAALHDLNRWKNLRLPCPDLIVVARGGGSIEDLWSFNEEAVARAIAASRIPIVSAIGHEIDFTIADFAADLRAPTPSAAAELIVPDVFDLQRRLTDLGASMTSRVQRTLDHLCRELVLLGRTGLAREPQRLLAQHGQRVDLLAADLGAVPKHTLRRLAQELASLESRLNSRRPDRWLAQQQQSVALLGNRLDGVLKTHLAATDKRCEHLRSLLQSLGPQSVFARGYSYTVAPDGRAVRSSSQLRPGQVVTTRFAEGKAHSEVKSVE